MDLVTINLLASIHIFNNKLPTGSLTFSKQYFSNRLTPIIGQVTNGDVRSQYTYNLGWQTIHSWDGICLAFTKVNHNNIVSQKEVQFMFMEDSPLFCFQHLEAMSISWSEELLKYWKLC